MGSEAGYHLKKVLVIGDEGVGKTTLLSRIHRVLEERQMPTVQSTDSVDFTTMMVKFGGDAEVKLQLWDVSGQPNGKKLIPNISSDTSVIIAVYDVTNPATLENLKMDIARAKSSSKNARVILVGTKADLEAQVTPDMLDAFKQAVQVSAEFVVKDIAADAKVLTTFRKKVATLAISITNAELIMFAEEELRRLKFAFFSGEKKKKIAAAIGKLKKDINATATIDTVRASGLGAALSQHRFAFSKKSRKGSDTAAIENLKRFEPGIVE